MRVAATRLNTFLKTLTIYVRRLCVCMKDRWHDNAHQVHACTHETLGNWCVHHSLHKECVYLHANMYCTGAFWRVLLVYTLAWYLDWHIHHAYEQYIVNHMHTSVLTSYKHHREHTYVCYSICKTEDNPAYQIISTAKAEHYKNFM